METNKSVTARNGAAGTKIYIMVLSNNELAAVLKLGLDMLMADGKVHKNEKKIIATEMMRFGVDETKIEYLSNKAISMTAAVALTFISNMDEEEKKHVAAFLAAVMVADDDIDDKEKALWRFVTAQASLPEMTIQEAVDYWKNH